MPLSKCRICGKKVPNPYRPYHERVMCLEMRRQKGELLHRELPQIRKPKETELEKGQTRLLSFGVEIER